MKITLSLVLITLLATAGPLSGEPTLLYSVSGEFKVRAAGPEASLEFPDERGREVTRYDLGGCRFTLSAAGEVGGDGAFALLFPGAVEPMVAVICHPVAGGQRFSIFAPARNRDRPILELTGDNFVRYAIRPGALSLSRDADGRTEEALWHPGVEADASDLASVRKLMAAAAGRRAPGPEPIADPGLRTLAGRLSEIAASKDIEALVAMAAPDILLSFGGIEGAEEFRQLATESAFWRAFERVLEGGGVSKASHETGHVAFFPALFRTWPNDLDAFENYYGDRPGARLRAGPSDHAPAIAELYGRIVVRGPYLEAFQPLYENGWMHVCTMAEGCGFAREQHIRSPIDWRAIFSQEKPGAPWILETYVAGD